MTDELNKPDREPPQEERRGPLAGERLAEARRRQQITVLEIAKELHLDEPKVRALEQNDFDVLSAPVFAKGHMRKYAQLVGVDFNDVLADYYHLNRSAGMPPVVLERRKRARDISPGPWIAGIVVILLAMAAYWLLVVSPISALDGSSRDIPAESSPPPVEQAPALATTTIEDDSTTQEVSVVPSLPAVVDDQVHLAVMFSADCWMEISDADGRRLYFEMASGGTSVEVSGAAPLSVLLGDADSASLRVNGADYSIAAADRDGQTATLTLYTP